MRLVLSANSPMGTSALKSHMYVIKKHSNAAGQSSRGSASKGQMQLTSYLWKKLSVLEKLWKSYGIFFLAICTNPVYTDALELKCHDNFYICFFGLKS